MATATAKRRTSRSKSRVSGTSRKVIFVLGSGPEAQATLSGVLTRLGAKEAEAPFPQGEAQAETGLEPPPPVQEDGPPVAPLADALGTALGKSRIALVAVPRAAALLPAMLSAAETCGRTPLLAVALGAGDGDQLDAVLRIEQLSRGVPRVFVPVDALGGRLPDMVAQIGRRFDLRWPKSAKSAAPQIAAFLAERRPAGEGDPASMPSGYARALDIFEQWLEHGEEFATVNELTAIRPEPETDLTPPAEITPELVTDGAAEALQQKLAELEAELARSRAAEAEARSEARAHAEEARLHAEEASALRGKAAAEAAASQETMQALHAEIEKLEMRYAETRDAKQAALDEAATLRSALAQREHERDDLRRELSGDAEHRQELEQKLAEALRNAERAEEKLARTSRLLTGMSRDAAAQLKRRLAQAQNPAPDPTVALAARLEERDRQIDTAREELSQVTRELERLREDAELGQGERNQLKSTLRRRETELVEQIAQRRALQAELAAAQGEADRIRSQIAAGQDEQAHLSEALDKARDEIEQVKARMAAEMENLERRRAEQHAHAEEQRLMLENWIHEMEASTSWRATRPLRSIISALRPPPKE
ncbi:hypothetical protein [Mangrovicoccus algicola]|uniref:Uncharacterized protein n=1 Tax=Mangrovicoccus algicola TaxID=2771008 RepID=A0A8J6YWI6_9RHOB|nr:hypothetical protein [Mangrovicoccus algicola]MBE3639047.1 hypothetical protein [Mangrovicoccus algicola]